MQPDPFPGGILISPWYRCFPRGRKYGSPGISLPICNVDKKTMIKILGNEVLKSSVRSWYNEF
jgi:hypothetical protein